MMPRLLRLRKAWLRIEHLCLLLIFVIAAPLRILYPTPGLVITDELLLIVHLAEDTRISDTLILCFSADGYEITYCYQDNGEYGSARTFASTSPFNFTLGLTHTLEVKLVDTSHNNEVLGDPAQVSFLQYRVGSCPQHLGESPKLFRASSFLNEAELVEIGLEEMEVQVDEFWFIESRWTQRNAPKALNFPECAENSQIITSRLSKIKYHVVEDQTTSEESMGAEEHQRDSLNVLLNDDIKDSDLILITDVDEIIDAGVLARIKLCPVSEPIILQLDWYQYNFNWRARRKWSAAAVGGEGPVLVTAGMVRQLPASAFRRLLRPEKRDQLVAAGLGGAAVAHAAGWHLSSFARPPPPPSVAGGEGGDDEEENAVVAALAYRFSAMADGTGGPGVGPGVVGPACLRHLRRCGVAPFELPSLPRDRATHARERLFHLVAPLPPPAAGEEGGGRRGRGIDGGRAAAAAGGEGSGGLGGGGAPPPPPLPLPLPWAAVRRRAGDLAGWFSQQQVEDAPSSAAAAGEVPGAAAAPPACCWEALRECARRARSATPAFWTMSKEGRARCLKEGTCVVEDRPWPCVGDGGGGGGGRSAAAAAAAGEEDSRRRELARRYGEAQAAEITSVGRQRCKMAGPGAVEAPMDVLIILSDQEPSAAAEEWPASAAPPHSLAGSDQPLGQPSPEDFETGAPGGANDPDKQDREGTLPTVMMGVEPAAAPGGGGGPGAGLGAVLEVWAEGALLAAVDPLRHWALSAAHVCAAAAAAAAAADEEEEEGGRCAALARQVERSFVAAHAAEGNLTEYSLWAEAAALAERARLYVAEVSSPEFAPLEATFRSGAPFRHAELGAAGPLARANFVHRLYTVLSDPRAALQLATELVDHEDMIGTPAVLLLDWAYLSCTAASEAPPLSGRAGADKEWMCALAARVIGVIAGAEMSPPELQVLAHFYLVAVWAELGRPDREDEHFLAAVELAAAHGLELPPFQFNVHLVVPSADDRETWIGDPRTYPDCFISHNGQGACARFLGDAGRHGWRLELGYDPAARNPTAHFRRGRDGARAGVRVHRIKVDRLLATGARAAALASSAADLAPPPPPLPRGEEGGVARPGGGGGDGGGYARCMGALAHCRVPPGCERFLGVSPDDPRLCRKPLFISGTACSGTKFAQGLLESWNLTAAAESAAAGAGGVGRRLVAVHEFFQLEHDILVGWNPRCDAMALAGLGPRGGAYPAAAAARGGGGGGGGGGLGQHDAPHACIYDRLLHQVRHPLKTFASMLSLGLLRQEGVREVILRNTWPPLYRVPRGEMYNGSREQLLEFAMLHWLTWNRQLEAAADLTYRVEDADWGAVLCEGGGLAARTAPGQCPPPAAALAAAAGGTGAGRNNASSAPSGGGGGGGASSDGGGTAGVARHSHHGGTQPAVTWAELERADPHLAAQVWAAARRYGYGRAPPPPPPPS